MRVQALMMLSILLGLLAPSCRSAAPIAPDTYAAERPGEFSADRAWGHLEALVRIGPRVTATEGGKRARAYITEELSKLDIQVETNAGVLPLPPDDEELPITNVVGAIPGDSADILILGAAYDSPHVEDFPFVGANSSASGAAVLLELARVLSERPRPYTIWLAFFDGEAPRETEDPERPNVALLGSTTFAINLRQHDLLSRVRFAVVFGQVGDADLRIIRDLSSDRVYREEFFQAAIRLGRADVFPRDQLFESPIAGHRSFLRMGLRRVVVLTDTSFGGEEPPGLYAGTADDDLEHCSPESLETVGVVALEAIETISRRLVKIDRFAEVPAREPAQVPAGPPEPAQEAAPAEEGGEESPDAEGGAQATEPEEEAASPKESAEAPAPEEEAASPKESAEAPAPEEEAPLTQAGAEPLPEAGAAPEAPQEASDEAAVAPEEAAP